MHIQCFEDTKCYSNYVKSNQGKEYELSNEEKYFLCNAAVASSAIKYYALLHQRRVLYCLPGGFSHFAVYSAINQHFLFLKSNNSIISERNSLSFAINITLKTFWSNDATL